ncbi:MAG: AAA family ATPase, partial [Candidatus Scatosoma sp.]
DPDVLILDEPTSGLDPVMQENFIGFIREEKKRGKTILLSSHIFSEIDATCDRIAIIKDGRVVSEFIADDLKHASRKFYTVVFRSPLGKTVFFQRAEGKVPSLNVLSESDTEIYISAEDKDLNELIALLSDINVTSFGNRSESLEDYFMKFYKEDKDFKGALQ